MLRLCYNTEGKSRGRLMNKLLTAEQIGAYNSQVDARRGIPPNKVLTGGQVVYFRALTWSPDGRFLALADQRGVVTVLQLQKTGASYDLEFLWSNNAQGDIASLTWLPDSRSLISYKMSARSGGPDIITWDADSGKLLGGVTFTDGKVPAVAVSTGGVYIRGDRSIHRCESPKFISFLGSYKCGSNVGALFSFPDLPEGAPQQIICSADGANVFTVRSRKPDRLFGIPAKQPQSATDFSSSYNSGRSLWITKDFWQQNAVVISHDGSWGDVILLDTATMLLPSPRIKSMLVSSCDFVHLADDSHLVATGTEASYRLYDLDSGKDVGIRNHRVRTAADCSALHPSSQFVASARLFSVWLWDWRDATPVCEARIPTLSNNAE